MELYDVVMKLVGPINPIGETNTDDQRFKNLQTMTELVDRLVSDIDRIATTNRSRPEYSMRRAGEFCDKFLTDMGIEE